MKVVSPHEALPALGTVANPAVLYDGNDAFICYEASHGAGGGNVVLKFGEVIDLRVTPMNVEGLKDCRYPINPWSFNEIIGGDETAKWEVLGARLWLISFNDVTIEVLFETASLISHSRDSGPQYLTLIGAMR